VRLVKHGTISAYNNAHCRCDECRAAKSAWVAAHRNPDAEAARRQRYKERHGGTCVDCGARTSLKAKGDVAQRCAACRRAYKAAAEHGLSAYRYGCRCAECRAANAAHRRIWWRRHHPPRPVPDHGTRARFQRGCTCPLCVEANRASKRAAYQRAKQRAAAS
jgi:hypothetical protein